ncbi:MAG: NAD(P)H-hydrate dehydratase [Candidatus Acidiferrales bacterium]
MKIVTAPEMRRVDALSAERYHISPPTLMESAGTSVADYLERRFPDLAQRQIFVLCGKGNNGGDGLVAARLLHERGARSTVVMISSFEGMRGDTATNLSRYQRSVGQVRLARNPEEWERAKKGLEWAHVIVDSLLGTGLRGPVDPLMAEVIACVNRHRRDTEVISVDIPSGVNADTGEISGAAITADATVTFTAPKVGMMVKPGSDHVGRLVVADIGSPHSLVEEASASKLRWIEPVEFEALPLNRRPDANKGTYGHSLIIAGSRGKSGAATMAGWAALRCGAGLVTVATPESELTGVGARVPELMTEPLPATEAGSIGVRSLEAGKFATLQKGKSVVAIGPGLTTHPETQQVVRALVKETPLPLILDADGLNAFAGRASEWKDHAAPMMVLTPHPGEFARLLGCEVAEVQNDRLKLARQAAAEWNLHVILKGNQTVIAAPDGHAWINLTGNPGMATGGTGDVLTGMLAGLVAQFGEKNWEGALCMAVYLHGLAGDIAAEAKGEAPLIATDVIEAIAPAYRRTLSIANRVG